MKKGKGSKWFKPILNSMGSILQWENKSEQKKTDKF